MRRMLPQLIRSACILVFAVSSGACGTMLWHSAKEINGQVVDAETGKPLEGVIVVAQWVPYRYGIGHAIGHRGAIHSYEALTDKEGRYAIPAWGPKLMPPASTIEGSDPNLRIFKAGYEPFSAANTVREFGIPGHPNQHATPLGVSEWDGVVIKLKPFRGSDSSYQDLLLRFGIGFQTEDGEWKNFPRMVWALEKEDRKLKRTLGGPLYLSVRIVDMRSLAPDDIEYLRRFEP